jgi:hypothetical protein
LTISNKTYKDLHLHFKEKIRNEEQNKTNNKQNLSQDKTTSSEDTSLENDNSTIKNIIWLHAFILIFVIIFIYINSRT